VVERNNPPVFFAPIHSLWRIQILEAKIYDDSVYEARKYAERRDDIGGLMFCVMMQVGNRFN
jgi:hypothetical protein